MPQVGRLGYKLAASVTSWPPPTRELEPASDVANTPGQFVLTLNVEICPTGRAGARMVHT